MGSSFLVEMNVKDVLKDLGRNDIEVEHTDLSSAWPGIADLIMCGADLYDNLIRYGDTIPIHNLLDKNEIKNKLVDYFESHQIK
jgi:PTS system ascorbate-specific IIB component